MTKSPRPRAVPSSSHSGFPLAAPAARPPTAEAAHLHEMDRLETRFFTTAAHELVSPLTPIALQLHLLRNSDLTKLTPQQRKSIEVLGRNVERLTHLVQELIDAARLESGHLKIERQPAELDILVGDVVNAHAPLAIAQGVTLEHRPPEPISLEADPKRISQVLTHLVGNAITVTPHGGRVAVECFATNAEAIVLVHDSGMGLTPEQVAQLFHPFSRVHADPPHGSAGAGLGLFLCKGFIELHGGRLWCESHGPGTGSTFAFSLPIASGVAPSHGA